MKFIKQISAKQIVLAAAIVIVFAIAALLLARHIQTPTATVGLYQFTLKAVSYYTRGHSRTLAEDLKEVHPDREVWVTIQADATSGLRAEQGYSTLSLYGPDLNLPYIIRNPRLVTSDGASILPRSAHSETGDLIWDRYTHHSQIATNFMVYIFPKPASTGKATFAADIYTDTTPPNTFPTPQTWPQAGRLRLNNIHIR